jgi:hypothetical protein
VDAGKTVPYILHSEVEKTIKEMKDKKAAGDGNASGDVLKLLGDDGLKTMTQLVNSMYETGEWPMDFTDVTMIALKRKPEARKCSNHCTISPVTHIQQS